jgi:hypothetical protein
VKISNKFPLQLYALVLCVCVLFVASCGKNETETLPDLAKDYFPLQIGKTLIYDVDTVLYDPISATMAKIDTFRWQVREVFIDTFRDITGLLTYKIERSERPRGSTAPFEFKKIFTAALSTEAALRTEDNLKFVKMPRYIGEKTTWDGNIYCNKPLIIEVTGDRMDLFSKEWYSAVLTLGKAEKIGLKDFTDVATIRAQSDPKIYTERRYTLEKYAKGIGLVYKEQQVLDSQISELAIAWEKRSRLGFIVKQTIVSFN